MSDENKIEEWIPDVEEYNPNISKEQWLQLIDDKSVFNENAIVTFACIKNANVATCSDMSEEFGREKNFYNNNVWLTGKKVYLKTNCQLSERDSEDDRYWSVCCLGRYLDNGRFEYKIRPELEEAFEEIGILNNVNLYNNMVDKEQEFRKWMSVQKYNDDKEYTPKTINSYCNALKNAPKNLNIEDRHKRSVFTYDDYSSYIDVMHVIRKASNFEEINRRYASGAFNAAMNLYEIFLKDDSHNYSKNQKNMNISNNNNNKYQEYIDILEANKNLILNGAPGTGKTWLAKKIAKEMGCSDNEIGFVQFHPSYDYTDFVEGLRPIEKDGNVGFERKDGVFKEFCKRAINNDNQQSIYVTKVSDNSFDSVYQSLINDIKKGTINHLMSPCKRHSIIEVYIDKMNNERLIFIGGKSTIKDYLKLMFDYFIEKNIYDLSYEKTNFGSESYFKLIKDLTNAKIKKIDYINYASVLQELLKRTKNNIDVNNLDLFENREEIVESYNLDKAFVFIIDEINRGEISKIFGELFYCIDPGYRGTKGRVYTQYQNLVPEGDVFENGFYVPENIYIIGTMNDIDRSVESMDFAFRRRFAFKEIKANENLDMLNDLGDLAKESKNRLINLNNKISEIEGLDSSYHIGASYFLKIKDYQGDFGKLWEYHLKGLLREYMRGMSDVKTKLESLKVAYDNESVSNN